jgi:hypothetical protein
MNELEKKIYKYLLNPGKTVTIGIMAHDLVEIAKKEQKYLSRKEVEKIMANSYTIPVIEVDNDGIHQTGFGELDIDKAITAICNLAIPSKEKIIEVLKNFKFNLDESQSWNDEKLANDILSNKQMKGE